MCTKANLINQSKSKKIVNSYHAYLQDLMTQELAIEDDTCALCQDEKTNHEGERRLSSSPNEL